MHSKLLIGFVALVLNGFLLMDSFAGPPLPPVSVSVSQTSGVGGVLYEYFVFNNSDSPVTSLRIGFDYFMGKPELTAPPENWSIDSGLPASSFSVPAGWQARIIATEDTDLLELEFNVTSPAAAIPPHGFQAGFKVTVPQENASYKTSHWTTVLDAKSNNVYSYTLSPQAACDLPPI